MSSNNGVKKRTISIDACHSNGSAGGTASSLSRANKKRLAGEVAARNAGAEQDGNIEMIGNAAQAGLGADPNAAPAAQAGLDPLHAAPAAQAGLGAAPDAAPAAQAGLGADPNAALAAQAGLGNQRVYALDLEIRMPHEPFRYDDPEPLADANDQVELAMDEAAADEPAAALPPPPPPVGVPHQAENAPAVGGAANVAADQAPAAVPPPIAPLPIHAAANGARMDGDFDFGARFRLHAALAKVPLPTTKQVCITTSFCLPHFVASMLIVCRLFFFSCSYSTMSGTLTRAGQT